MTGSSARKSSASDLSIHLGAQDVHLWLGHRDAAADSDTFRRAVLSRYAPISASDWQFTAGDHGKPLLVGSPRPLSFNTSHSRDWLALAVAAGTPLGIDLEYCDPRRQVLKLARRCFSAPEVAGLRDCAPGECIQRFYDYWTLKEAGIKARGSSLAMELESTGFDLDFPLRGEPGRIVPNSPPGATGDYFCLLDPLADYRLALCCRLQGISPPGLRLRELLPGGGARPLPLVLRAVSVCTDTGGEVDTP